MFQFLKKIPKAFAKTRQAIAGRITSLFKGPWDENTFDQLEQILYEADLGSAVTSHLVEATRAHLKKNRDAKLTDVLAFLAKESLDILSSPSKATKKAPAKNTPRIILVVGVNGSGKTTTIAKLANHFKQEGQSVLLAAGDTFRAAAIEQLETWAERIGVPIVSAKAGGDPAALAYDATTAAKARGIDTLIIDTAGRLQNKSELMRELEKVCRVIQKVIPNAPHETLLVLDSTTGQNAVDQAEVFHATTPLSGIILAKIDGSAKGGIALSIYKKLSIPTEWIGVGEGINDLMPFDKKTYVKALFSRD